MSITPTPIKKSPKKTQKPQKIQNVSCGASMERYGPGEQLRMVFNDLRVVQPRVVPCAICTWVPSSPTIILRLIPPSVMLSSILRVFPNSQEREILHSDPL